MQDFIFDLSSRQNCNAELEDCSSVLDGSLPFPEVGPRDFYLLAFVGFVNAWLPSIYAGVSYNYEWGNHEHDAEGNHLTEDVDASTSIGVEKLWRKMSAVVGRRRPRPKPKD